VTLGALTVALGLLAILAFSTLFAPYAGAPKSMWVEAANDQAVPLARMLLSQSPPNTAGIAELVNYTDTAKFQSMELLRAGNVTLFARATASLEMLVFDGEGALLGRTGRAAFPDTGQTFDVAGLPRLRGPLEAALAGDRDPDHLVSARPTGDRWAVAVPVYTEDGSRLLGAVAYVADAIPEEDAVAPHALGFAAGGALLLLAGTGVISTGAGYLLSRGPVRRIRRLSGAADAWSRGDFAVAVDEEPDDEIGRLARRLNEMAGHLQALLARRQALAVLEERQRLARDLHDSAKQQALAASFQIGTTLTLLDHDVAAAREHLAQADRLVDSVRRELTDLILKMRPAPSEAPVSADGLFSLALDWARQTGIEVATVGDPGCLMAPQISRALHRIEQEALANIARHSGATTVRLTLTCTNDAVALAVADDGHGFDTARQSAGTGLHSMRERIASLGGTYALTSGPDGTTVYVTLPQIAEEES